MTQENPQDRLTPGDETRTSLQAVVDSVARRHTGDDPHVVREALERETAAAGHPVAAEKWLGDAAVEIAAGRGLVVDGRRHLQDDDAP